MNSALCCTACGEAVIKSMTGGDTKLRAKVILFKDSGTIAICKGCGTEIPVPLTLDTNMVKSFSQTTRLRLYVKK